MTKYQAIPPIPGLPRGWEVVEFKRGVLYPRDAVIVCERNPLSDNDCNYVCWWVNMVEGGCHQGVYSDSYRTVSDSFAGRKVN